jgi:hypothetical protein
MPPGELSVDASAIPANRRWSAVPPHDHGAADDGRVGDLRHQRVAPAPGRGTVNPEDDAADSASVNATYVR